jgi:excisionase family DNA binding protein
MADTATATRDKRYWVAAPLPSPKPVYSAREAAAILGIGMSKMYETLERGEIGHLRLGNRILIPAPSLDTFLAKAATGEG